ncbi:hypothetical protein A6R68_01822, partial [Neotoma lepida]
FQSRGYECRDAVNSCDITEYCTGDSGQGRCYNGECKTRDNQCQYIWGTILDDDTDVGYVEDGTPCGPSMMCLDRKCLQIQALNMSSCPLDSKGKVCSGHGVCSNEATCICDFTWAGTDCSIRDPVRNPNPPKDEGPK